ncbi:MAG TPA: outer membrane beta-barrel protein [Steroidobacteraceae bacterium]
MSRKVLALIGAWLVGVTGTSTALAQDVLAPLGVYIGGAFGRSNVRVDNTETRDLFSFNESHAAWKALVGIRPIAPLGAELEYIDFGHPARSLGGISEDARARAAGLFAVAYLPIPLVDVYGKAGIARLQTIAKGTLQTLQPTGQVCSNSSLSCIFDTDHTDTRFAYGAGVQVKVLRVGVRAEYERISAPGGDPSLLSLGLTWTF